MRKALLERQNENNVVALSTEEEEKGPARKKCDLNMDR